MKKALAMFLVMGLTVTAFTGCGNKNTEQKTQDTTSKVASEKKVSTSSDELVVYSPAPEGLLNMIIQEFQDETGVKVELIQAGTGELLTRIQSESENPLADVMFGGGAESMEAYKEYFDAYESVETKNVNEAYRSKENLWTGAFVSPTVIMYNKNLVAENEAPKGWADLVDSKWKGKLAFADPTSSGSAYTTLSILLTAMDNGDGGWGYIRKYVDTLNGNILSSSSAPHSESAKKFVDFVLSKEVQSKIPEHLYRQVRTDLEDVGDFVPLSEILLKNYNFLGASTNKESNIKQWNDIVIGK